MCIGGCERAAGHETRSCLRVLIYKCVYSRASTNLIIPACTNQGSLHKASKGMRTYEYMEDASSTKGFDGGGGLGETTRIGNAMTRLLPIPVNEIFKCAPYYAAHQQGCQVTGITLSYLQLNLWQLERRRTLEPERRLERRLLSPAALPVILAAILRERPPHSLLVYSGALRKLI